MLTVSRVLCCASLGAALLAPSVASAAPVDVVATTAAASERDQAEVDQLATRVAAPGSSFTLKGRARTRDATPNARRCGSRCGAPEARSRSGCGLKTLAGSAQVALLTYDVKVLFPRNLAEGTYYVRACADYGRRTPLEETRRRLHFATRRVAVSKPATAPAAPKPATPVAPATPSRTPVSAGPFPPAVSGREGPDLGLHHARRRHDAGRHRRHQGRCELQLHRHRAAPADVGAASSRDYSLDHYRAVVFLNTGCRQPAQRRAAGELRGVPSRGGGFVGIGSAIETDGGRS